MFKSSLNSFCHITIIKNNKLEKFNESDINTCHILPSFLLLKLYITNADS